MTARERRSATDIGDGLLRFAAPAAAAAAGRLPAAAPFAELAVVGPSIVPPTRGCSPISDRLNHTRGTAGACDRAELSYLPGSHSICVKELRR